MGWSDFDRNCYKLFSTVGTWYNAAEHFQDVGADLTSVHSRREEDFLNYLAEGGTYYMGGMIKLGGMTNGDLFWRSDGSEVDYEHYYHPNTWVNPGECLYQYEQDIGKGWRTTSCESRLPFVCKLKPLKPCCM